ncbi:MAG: ribosome silencing factor [Chloroflexota bacterium]
MPNLPCCPVDRVGLFAIIGHGGRLLEPSEIARLASEAASEKQASDIIVLDVHASCSFADYFVIASAESVRQLNAVWEAIMDALKGEGALPLHKEGTAESGWLLADYGSVVIHLFAVEEREIYRLEALWKDSVAVLRMQ